MSNYESLLTEREAAKFLGLSHRTLQTWRQKGWGPPFLKLGFSVRYHKQDLQNFMEQCKRRHTTQHTYKILHDNKTHVQGAQSL